jgi:teichuronic acid biosynthesis glycosyltransferase TuaG
MSNPLISVIIPYWNEFDLVCDAIRSVLNQTYDNVEIIVVADGVDPELSSTLFAETGLDEHIVHFNLPKSGVSTARNFGVKQANGEYISFLDADDIFLPDKLEKQLDYMFSNHLDISATSYIRRTGSSNQCDRLEEDDVVLSSALESPYNLITCTIALTTILSKKEILILNPFQDEIPNGEDICCWLDIFLSCGPIFILLEPLTIVRVDACSHSVDPARQIGGLLSIAKYIHRRYSIFTWMPSVFQSLIKVASNLLKSLPEKSIYSVSRVTDQRFNLCEMSKKAVISISQSPIENVDGGIQACIRAEISTALSNYYDYIHVYPVSPMEGDSIYSTYSNQLFVSTYSSNGVRREVAGPFLLSKYLLLYDSCEVVIHSAIGHSILWLEKIARDAHRNNINTIFVFHDFFSVCQSFHLIASSCGRNYYCNLPDIDSYDCSSCNYSVDRYRHIAAMHSLLSKCHRLVAFSEFTRNKINSFFMRNAFTLPSIHLVSPAKVAKCPPAILNIMRPRGFRSELSHFFVIAYYGACSDSKGWSNFVSLSAHFSNDPSVQFVCLSSKNPQNPGIKWIPFSSLSSGDYSGLLLIIKLFSISAFFFWPNIPETYGIAFHQCIASGQIVLAPRHGLGGCLQDTFRSLNLFHFESIDECMSFLRDRPSLAEFSISDRKAQLRDYLLIGAWRPNSQG